MIAIICAIASGMTIVLSRSINGYLAKKNRSLSKHFL